MRRDLNLNTVTLWAMWKYSDAEVSECKLIPSINQTSSFLDKRDNSRYTIARLKDGRCWMTQNLKIANKTISSEDSDMTSGSFTIPSSDIRFGPGGWGKYGQYDTPYVYIDTANAERGGYYSFYAATAGEGTKAKTGGDTHQSICPKGWRLPTKIEAQELTSHYTLETIKQSPANFNSYGWIMNGNCGSGVCQLDNVGIWHTSTVTSETGAYNLYYNSNGIWPTSQGKLNGFGIRCISGPKPEIESMQNIANWGSKISKGQSLYVSDDRDEDIYTAARLSDGKLWMTQNLRIGKSSSSATVLHPEDSDIEDDFTLPAYTTTNSFKSFDIADNTYSGEPYGSSYTWFAATAGEGTQNMNSGQVEHSICPKGWRLPTREDFSSLLSSYGNNSSKQLFNSPANFYDRGYYYNGSFNGTYDSSSRMYGAGYFWSSTSAGSSNAYNLLLKDAGAGSTVTSGTKYYGYSVRCIAREQ